MKRASLFFICCILAGAGAMLGSIIGNAWGKSGLFAGGFAGGLIGCILAVRIATWRRWIPADATTLTSVGAAIGFMAAAFIATRTLSSPIGPALSTSLIGIGALAGATISSKRSKIS